MSVHTITHTIRSARGLYLRGVEMWATPCKKTYNEGILVTEAHRKEYPTLDDFVRVAESKICNAHDGRYLKYYTVHND